MRLKRKSVTRIILRLYFFERDFVKNINLQFYILKSDGIFKSATY